MPDQFPYDVFLSHSAKDKAAVRPLAERLRKDGLKVPLNFGFQISDFGFAQPMSANAFSSDWAQLLAHSQLSTNCRPGEQGVPHPSRGHANSGKD